MKTRKGLALCAAALALAMLAGCGTKKSSSTSSSQSAVSTAAVSLSDTLELGAKYLSSLNFEGAILQYTAVLKADSGNKDALAGLYAAYAASGETEQAESVFDEAEQLFDDITLFLPYVLDDAGLVSENGGGSDVFKSLSDHYLSQVDDMGDESENSLEQIGQAWLDADPQNPDAYVPLSVYYQQNGDDEDISNLTALAEKNGVTIDDVNAAIKVAAGEGYTITTDAGDLGEIEITVTPDTTPKDVTSQATSQAVNNATSEVLRDAGIDSSSPGADIAEQMIKDTLNQGLSAMG